ncbi:hypothetical protein [Saccharopolyspora sp. NPDC002376]
MAEQIVTGLVPPEVTGSSSPVEAGSGERRSLPLPVITQRHKLLVTYGMTRIDASGRVPAAPVLHALQWHPGQSLTIRVTSGAVILQPDPGGIRIGDTVMLVADPRRDMVLVDPLTAVDEALQERHALLAQDWTPGYDAGFGTVSSAV